jgi:hypothetical protein
MGAQQSLSPERIKTRIFLKLYNDGAGKPVRDQLMTAFNKYDTDGSQQISKAELRDAAESLDFPSNDAAIDVIFAEMDEDKSGEVGFEEFLIYLCGPPPDEKEEDEETPAQFSERTRIYNSQLRIEVYYFDIWGDSDPFLGLYGIDSESLTEMKCGQSKEVSGKLVGQPIGDDKDPDLNAFVQGDLKGTLRKAFVIDVDVSCCTDLPKMDLTSESDPYVVIKWKGATVFTSETVQNSANPIFDQAITQIDLSNDHETGELHLEVYDKNVMTKDKFIGRVTMAVDQLVALGKAHHQESRELEGGTKKKKGQIQFSLKAREMCVFTLKELGGLLEINGNAENGGTTGDCSIADSPYGIVYWKGLEAGKTKMMEGLRDPCNPKFEAGDKAVFHLAIRTAVESAVYWKQQQQQ